MSQQLISRSPDLKRLQDVGYDLAISGGHLLIRDVPYVNTDGMVKRGVLVSELTLAGDITTTPSTHVAMFAGEYPCDKDSNRLERLVNNSRHQDLGEGIIIDHTFSSKPQGGYRDYYDKITTYIALLASPAQALDPDATAQTFPVIEDGNDTSPFTYVDTASSRAEIGAISARLVGHKIGIAGVGGTGSYLVDQVAKTPVAEVHLWDGDTYQQHNAFRSPGAPTIDELRAAPNKVQYFANIYSKMHRGIVAHEYDIDESNVKELRDMDFVFVAIGDGDAKKTVVEFLIAADIPFIDVGIGVYKVDESLAGTVRVTTATPIKHEHTGARIPISDEQVNCDYATNIQIADLNALNAALAVIKWKKLIGFYNDIEREHQSTYDIDGNHLTNEDHA